MPALVETAAMPEELYSGRLPYREGIAGADRRHGRQYSTGNEELQAGRSMPGAEDIPDAEQLTDHRPDRRHDRMLNARGCRDLCVAAVKASV